MARVSSKAKTKSAPGLNAAVPKPLSGEELLKIDAYWQACKYLAVGMIYLQDNPP
jgi:xylulose-5-phosphate/fructose-6-phosphate phosphoketolase